MSTPQRPSNIAKLCLAVVLTALLVCGFAIVFRSAINYFFNSVYSAKDVVSAFRRLPWYLRLVVPAAGGAFAGYVASHAAKHRSGHGVGGVMESIVLGTSRISLRASLWKAFGCWCAIISGGSIGREGPIIQMGGALGELVAKKLGLTRSETRKILCAGIAAGFSAAYNTPLAAILFVLEVVTGIVAVDLVLITVFGAASATFLTRLAIGGGPIYGERSFGMASEWELGAYMLLGILSGVAGAIFILLLKYGERAFERIPCGPIARPALGGMAVGLLLILYPEVAGNGYETINDVLDAKLLASTLLVLVFFKSLATTASVSSGAPGGVFTPTLFLGAALGGSFGSILQSTWSNFGFDLGAYALVGMAAVCAATIHAPILASVLTFELSGDYKIVIPLLISTSIATLISKSIHPFSIYESELAKQGIGWRMTLEGREMKRNRDGL